LSVAPSFPLAPKRKPQYGKPKGGERKALIPGGKGDSRKGPHIKQVVVPYGEIKTTKL